MKKLVLIFIILLLLVFAACRKETPEAAETEATEPVALTETGETAPPTSSEPEEETEFEEEWWMEGSEEDDEEEEEEIVETAVPQVFYSHLTGIQVNRAQQRKRPVAIMINNIRQAQPTVGVSHAEIIYEAIVEGGATRLMMLLSDYETVPVLGSVRSAREYYVDLMQTHDAIFIHAGGATSAYAEMNDPARNIDRLDGVNPVKGRVFPNTFYRDAERRRTMSVEHTLMATGRGIVLGLREARYRTRHNMDYTGTFNFNEEITPLPENNTANYVSVPYSAHFQPEFIYNPADKLYYRTQFGAAHLDGATGEQLRFENVIVIFAEYTDLQTREGLLACKLTGTGFGFYINGGKYITIRWRKETRDSGLYLFNLNGSDLYLNPGKSFISVTSTAYNRSVVINSDLKEIG